MDRSAPAASLREIDKALRAYRGDERPEARASVDYLLEKRFEIAKTMQEAGRG